MQSKTTRDFLLAYRQNKRPFLLSRSTFAGSGALVNHWTGDNEATWQDLHISISSVFDFGIFGIPMVGADICGFTGNTTEELCARWIEVGAFYPFSRNHNAIEMESQELYLWESVAEASRRALAVRYKLLPYFYTMYQYSVEVGWPVARPLVFEFPQVPETAGNDRQMLIGGGILVSPVLEEGATTVRAFFPAGKWYDWYDYTEVTGTNAFVILDANLEHINVHIRGGSIIPMQPPGMTTVESRANNFQLLVATNGQGKASGELYVDDGESLDGEQRWVQFKYDSRVLQIGQKAGGRYEIKQRLSTIVLLGVPEVSMVFVNGVAAKSDIKLTNGTTVVSGLLVDLNAGSSVAFR
ncbi:hypothetical protein GGF37_003014 [Kickxella alabastrina]|nr:hypothetical protein GGF37_003014 [Kickxella alabastrina]